VNQLVSHKKQSIDLETKLHTMFAGYADKNEKARRFVDRLTFDRVASGRVGPKAGY
jgi:hypothetical protein